MGHKDNRMQSLAEESQLLGEASPSRVVFKCRALRKTHELWYFMNHSSIHVLFNFPSSNWHVWSARSAGSKLVSCLSGFFLCLYLSPKALLIETEPADNKVLGRNKQVSTFARRTTWLWLWGLIWKLRWGWDGQSRERKSSPRELVFASDTLAICKRACWPARIHSACFHADSHLGLGNTRSPNTSPNCCLGFSKKESYYQRPCSPCRCT